MLFGIELPEKKEDTYQKKLRGICALDKIEENVFGAISNADLKEILEYYLVLKIIRNQIGINREPNGMVKGNA